MTGGNVTYRRISNIRPRAQCRARQRDTDGDPMRCMHTRGHHGHHEVFDGSPFTIAWPPLIVAIAWQLHRWTRRP